MKQDFKKWLNNHKGKELDTKMIKMISERHEDSIGDMLYNEGLHLTNVNTGQIIIYGDCQKDYKNWTVQNYEWKAEREFVTLQGAIKFTHK